MTFVHDDPEFVALLTQVSAETGIAAALVEKDYWITHSLWALHKTELAIWFKGGTSLSKGFGTIERFSEDLDLMIQRGGVTALPEVTNWASTNKGPTAQRRAFYDALPLALAIPARRSRGRSGLSRVERRPETPPRRLTPKSTWLTLASGTRGGRESGAARTLTARVSGAPPEDVRAVFDLVAASGNPTPRARSRRASEERHR